MVSSEFGIGAFEGWISGGFGLFDTAGRREVSVIRDIRVVRALSAIAEWESERRGNSTRFGVPCGFGCSQSQHFFIKTGKGEKLFLR